MCPSGASAGGDLGKFKQGMMDPVFDRAVFQTGQVGEVSKNLALICRGSADIWGLGTRGTRSFAHAGAMF